MATRPDDNPSDEGEGDELIDDEYETDSEEEDSESEEDDEEEEQWSLRVRLLSAVDLPPSLSPHVPLCPWFKFGLVDDINAALDQVAEEKKRASEEAKEREERKTREGIDDEGSSAEDSEVIQRRSSSSAENNPNTQMNTTSRLISTLPPNCTRTSESKIMARNANGGGGNGADWNEEYRWNDLGSPMEGCLLVRLNTRLSPDGGGSRSSGNIGMGGMGGMGMKSSMDYGDAASDNGSGGYLNGSDEVGIGSGIRGLWRKGRQQLEEHRRTSVAGPREERAAAVAQFLMRGGNPDDATAATAGTSLSASQHSGLGGLNQQDLAEYQHRLVAQKEEYQALNDGAVRTVKSEEEDDDLNNHTAEGLCLGTLTIPLSRLPLEDAFIGNNAAVVEKWYQLDDPNLNSKKDSSTESEGMGDSNAGLDDEEPTLLHGPRRCPSVLLEITFASSDYLDESEDDVHGWDNDPHTIDLTTLNLAANEEKAPETPVPSNKEEVKEKQEEKKKEPELDPGIFDFVCVVGARDIGNQRNDDGSKGWVQSTPECCVLERYPPTDDFHINNGRNTGLIPQIEWFCFPEGCKLWRGADAPRYADLRAGGVSTVSSNVGDGSDSGFASTKFDKQLGTTTSFSWFVLSTNSDVYGSRLVKTYGTMIRFYVPAPKGIDPTQDDFAQTMTGGPMNNSNKGKDKAGGDNKRLWVPIGICITTTLPIVGIVEEILLRMCTAMRSKELDNDGSATECLTATSNDSSSPYMTSKLYTMLQTDLYHLMVNFSRPMDGVLHCSIPLLEGERLHVTTSPLNGLPPLPHGGAVAATCRLLGAEGLTLLLAATLTECRVLIHSVNVAHVAMVAEVITALIFPFTWQLPYIPVLPKGMLEILDAPLPFFVGVPTHSLQGVENSILSEVVVVDLDDVSSFSDARRGPRTKIPPALPASVSTSISKAVFRLLKEEDELEQEMKTAFFPGLRRSPRLEAESQPERMFRIHVGLQICSLVRGYQECLFFVSALQPVFNRDRFLRQAPALFEDKRPSVLIDQNISDRSQKILSQRSKRFLSVLVNSQLFHQLLERLSSEETAFFHEVMEAIEGEEDPSSSASTNDANTGGSKNHFTTSFGSSACDDAAKNLFESLELIEQRIPTYVVNRPGRRRLDPGTDWTWHDDGDEDFKIESYVETNDPFWLLPEEKKPSLSFTYNVLQPIMADRTSDPASSSGEAGVHALSLEYLVELEKNPWRYGHMLELPMSDSAEGEDNESTVKLLPPVNLREAIGERRFRAWKIANDHKDDGDDVNVSSPTPQEQAENDGFDLSSILLNVPDLPLDGSKPTGGGPRVDANDRQKVKNCLELAFGSGQATFEVNGRDLIAEAELALRNQSAQRYLFSVLNESVQRRNKRSQEDTKLRGTRTSSTGQQSVSRLEPSAFECIVRLCYAVLEACSVEADYESAYRLLTFTGGFCTATTPSAVSTQSEQKTIYMTERISIHPIFADLRLWERVLLLHQQDQPNKEEEDAANDAESNGDGEEGSTSEDVIAGNEDTSDNDAYDNTITTLYEMVGYNVPAEEVSRFATRISEEKGWFATEKGQALLVLARRLTAKRDEGDAEKSGGAAAAGEFASFIRKESGPGKDLGGGVAIGADDAVLESEEISWSHPSTCLVSYERQGGARAFLGNMLGGVAAESQMVGTHSSHGLHKNSSHGLHRSSSSKRGTLDANSGDYAGRVAITAMASFGGSAVVSGGIDGSLFLAHTINFGADKSEFDFNCPAATSTCPSPLHSNSRLVNGMQLQWGSIDRDSYLGSVTCIAASKGPGYRFGGADKTDSKPGSDECPDEEEIISSMDGCQVIAGTTCGSLRVWSLKDIFFASCMTNRENVPAPASSPTANRSHHGSGATSVRLGADDFGMQEAVAGAPVGGHRGGVSCVDLPPRMYCPDSLVSGGEDGLIKLWSLKSQSSDQDGAAQKNSIQSRFFRAGQPITSITDFDASDAQSVLTGHEGRIICIKTAWHGDKLLSGGADKTVRLWDCSGSGGKPITTLRGHQATVTQTHFWGPNTIVSASTDRSIHLWDTRVGTSPLFVLRYHLSPVSDLLLGNRSEPLIVSAGADGSLATWDFRVLSGARAEDENAESARAQSSRTIRSPMATMNHIDHLKSSMNCGSVKLARAIARDDFSFFSVSDDGVVNEWEAASGGKVSMHDSGHNDAISGFSTFSSTDGLRQNKSSGGAVSTVGGTITCSWDGTVRLRRLSRKSAR